MISHKTGYYLLTVLLLAGCSSMVTYRTFDQPRSPDQVAVLWIPINLEPLDVDGKKVGPHYIPVSDRYKIELLPGAHTFVVRYSGVAGGPSCEQEEMINSPPVTLTLDAVPGHTYRLAYDRDDIALLFAKQLANITIKVDDITANAALVQQLNCGWRTRNVMINKPAVTTDSAAAPKPATLPAPAPTVPPPAPPPAKAAEPMPTAAEQLRQWWRQADKNERGEFLKWTVQQK